MSGDVAQFEHAAIQHGRHEDESGNSYAEELAALAGRLRESGKLAQLRPLTEHSDANVRAWAASYMLEIDPAHSETVLESIATEEQGPIGFSAEQTLIEWRAGRLHLP